MLFRGRQAVIYLIKIHVNFNICFFIQEFFQLTLEMIANKK